tara:strand:- start:1819 stop:3171 length:1353 start_codon:yes stop_codon:yes gene_type:complete
MLWFASFTLLMLVIRGFAEGTWIGGVLDVPIAPPMAVMTLGIAVVWLLRSTGLWSPHGPIRDHDIYPGFTGRAGGFWSRLALTNREWIVLEIYEPLILSASGIVLLLFPWTRVTGVMLILMAMACTYQTFKDLQWNVRGEGTSAEDYMAGVFSSSVDEDDLEFDDAPYVPDSPYAELPDDLVALMDDDAKEAIEAARSNAFIAPARSSRSKSAKGHRFVELRPRGAASHHPGKTFALVFYLVLAYGIVLGITSPHGIYKQSPDRWRSAILSVQTGASRLLLTRPADREQAGGLATVVLNQVAPDDLGKLRRDMVRRERSRVDAQLEEAETALQMLRSLVNEKTGIEPDASSTTPQLDELVLEHDSVADAWVALINGTTGYAQKIDDARNRLDSIRSPEGVDVDAYDALFDEVEPWNHEINILEKHINHIATMLKTKQFEDALDRTPGGGP